MKRTSFSFSLTFVAVSLTFCNAVLSDTSVLDSIVRADSCTSDLHRCAGEEGYPVVTYLGCCSKATHSCISAPELGWGKFCMPNHNAGHQDTQDEASCYSTGQRCEGSPGMPYVSWKPCCGNAECREDAALGWGKFCTSDQVSSDTSSDVARTCTKTNQRCAGSSGMPYIPYSPCCNDYDECTEVRDLGWGMFCVPKIDHSAPDNSAVESPAVGPAMSKPLQVTRLASTRVETSSAARQSAGQTSTSPSATTVTTAPRASVTTASPVTTTIPVTTASPVTTTIPVTTASPVTTTIPVTTTSPVTTQTAGGSTAASRSTSAAAEPVKCGRVRKEIMDMSEGEMTAYVQAFKTLRDKPGQFTKSLFDDFVHIHKNAELQWHVGQYFLPAHRMYLWKFETELQRISPGVTIPYHDWSINNKNWTSDPAWDRLGGLTGGALAEPFKGWMTFGNDTQPVSRTAIKGKGMTSDNKIVGIFESRAELDLSIARTDQSFADFSYYLEILHGVPHRDVGGTMVNGNISPSDPFFFSHHAFVDKIWRDWQLAGNNNKFDGRYRVEPQAKEGEKQKMGDVVLGDFLYPKEWNYTTASTMTELGPCVTYQEAGRRAKAAVRVMQFQSEETELEEKKEATKLKEENGDVYKSKVADVKESEESFKDGALFSGIWDEILQRALESKRFVTACAHGVLPSDAREPDRILNKSPEEIEQEGRAQMDDMEKNMHEFEAEMNDFVASAQS